MNVRVVKGFITAVVMSCIFIFLGISLRSFFHSEDIDPSKSILTKMETGGAPPLELRDINSNSFVLSNLLGKVVVVNFWATWCAPCVEEFPSMLKFLESFRSDVNIVAVSVDKDRQDIVDFLSAFGGIGVKGLYVLQDEDMSIAKSWGTDKIPESYIFDRDHKLVKKVAASENWTQPMVYDFFREII